MDREFVVGVLIGVVCTLIFFVVAGRYGNESVANIFFGPAEVSESVDESVRDSSEDVLAVGEAIRLVQNWSWEVVLSDGTRCVIVKMAHATCDWGAR